MSQLTSFVTTQFKLSDVTIQLFMTSQLTLFVTTQPQSFACSKTLQGRMIHELCVIRSGPNVIKLFGGVIHALAK